MKPSVLLTIISTLFFSAAANTEPLVHHNDDPIYQDILFSQQALRDLDHDPASVPSRMRYLSSLKQIVIDFNKLSIPEKNRNLTQTRKKMARLALTFMQIFNRQHHLGADLNSNLGEDLFTDINSTDLAHERVIASTGNRGTADITVDITDVHELTLSDYDLIFDAKTHYIFLRKSDNTIVSSSDISSFPLDIVADGLNVHVNQSNTAVNDTFLISPLRHALYKIELLVIDPGKLALAWPIIAEVEATNSGGGSVHATEMIDTNNSVFSLPQQLNPSLTIMFLSPTSYELLNADTNSMIEGPLSYNPSVGSDIFPSPQGYDPGFRLHVAGDILAGDSFNINYNLSPVNDNRNGLSLEMIYPTILQLF